MDFSIERKQIRHKTYPQKDLDVAYKFAQELRKELGDLLKAVVLFGSTVKEKPAPDDIDILVVLDDLTVVWKEEIMETYKIIAEKKILEISPKIHVTTLRLTTFWEYIRIGDPVGMNILRDGVALLDTGFFDPLQALLKQGRIKPTAESIWNYLNRANQTMDNARNHLLTATVDLYWTCVDAGQAAIMKKGLTPPAPEKVADLLEQKLKAKKHADTMRLLYKVYKAIIHRKVDTISGDQFEQYYVATKKFLEVMKKKIND